MAAKFLHIGCNTIQTDTIIGAVQEILNDAADWLRYAPNCWLVYTYLDAAYWQKRLSGIKELRAKGFLICEANIEHRSGYLTKEIWEWFTKSRVELSDAPQLPLFDSTDRTLQKLR